jgi:hypothetical protein
MPSLFTLDHGFYLPTRHTFAGWANNTIHGSPVAALLAHAVEAQRAKDPDLLVTRLTVDLMRPVHRVPFTLETELVREGRRLKLLDVRLLHGGTLIARASALLLRRTPGNPPGEQTLPPGLKLPHWSEVPLRHWDEGIERDAREAEPGAASQYFRAVEVRRINEMHSGEPLRAWVRAPFELLPGVPLSPLARCASVADFASAIGMLSRRGAEVSFLNADISLALHREPVGEWLCLENVGRGDRDGLTSSSVNLHDEQGLVGHSVVGGIATAMPVVPPSGKSL